ncbi:hypothetical protein BpHYR1_047907, partial [Brachionus plicatilis]
FFKESKLQKISKKWLTGRHEKCTALIPEYLLFSPNSSLTLFIMSEVCLRVSLGFLASKVSTIASRIALDKFWPGLLFLLFAVTQSSSLSLVSVRCIIDSVNNSLGCFVPITNCLLLRSSVLGFSMVTTSLSLISRLCRSTVFCFF